MALMLAICSPQPNWMPRKPKLMFQICQKLFGGFCMIAPIPLLFLPRRQVNHPKLYSV